MSSSITLSSSTSATPFGSPAPHIGYFHEDRTHLGLGKDTPSGRSVTPPPAPTAKVVAMPRVGGHHHLYEWRKAA